MRALYNNHIYGDDFRKGFEQDGLPQHVDLPRLRAGKNGGAFWSVYVACPANGTDYSDDNYAESEWCFFFYFFFFCCVCCNSYPYANFAPSQAFATRSSRST